MKANLREWFLGGLGVLIALATLYNATVSTRLRSEFESGYDRGKSQGHDAVQDVLIAANKAWADAHEKLTAPLIPEHQLMAKQWPEALRLLTEIHLFLVREYHMPTSLPPPPPYGPQLEQPVPIPKGGAIAGERR